MHERDEGGRAYDMCKREKGVDTFKYVRKNAPLLQVFCNFFICKVLLSYEGGDRVKVFPILVRTCKLNDPGKEKLVLSLVCNQFPRIQETTWPAEVICFNS